ncbi:MAG: exopolyphosphatase [Gammaproteobacteria bacterium]
MSTPYTDGNPTLAAVDLGSNSFHMIVARAQEHGFRVVDRMRQTVRLAAGLDEDNNISDKAMARALACLEQFGERVRDLPRGAVRVVGTNTLRKARNAWDFITRAESALGHPIDVISGHEEARLIYLGVSHGLEDDAEQRLVMDIGGGSTEFILGRHFDPLYMESLHMGCVSHSAAFFSDGRIEAKALRAAEIAARQELEAIEITYRRLGWQSAIGASGTILAVREIVMRQGWSEEGITPQSLERLKQVLVGAGHVDALVLDGLSEDRRPVLPGGVAILAATFEALGIERMRVSQSALREGLLYDLLGRLHQEDVREQTVAELVRRYQIDSVHSERVAATASALYEQAAPAWGINGEDPRRILRWAAVLHEIGLSVSHSQYQKHSEYLLSNLEMPGFARGDQRRLAALVRGHRRKFPLAELGRFPPEQVTLVRRLCVLLRIACVLHRRRSEEPVPPFTLKVDGDALKLGFPPGWLGGHPLTRADLDSEAGYLKPAGIKFKIK